MGWLARLRGRHSKPALPEPGPAEGLLREFVYLDEVSVYSLVASRTGAITEETFEIEQTSSKDEVAGEIAASGGVLKSSVKSRLEAAVSSGSQVLRRSNVQATFKQLFELESSRLLLRPPQGPRIELEVVDAAGLSRLAEQHTPAVRRASSLLRGDLVELEVQLQADPIFRLRTAVAAVLEMFSDAQQLIPLAGRGALAQGQIVSRVLDSMLTGLVPIRAEVLNYVHVTAGVDEYVVESRLIDSARVDGVRVRPLHLVGVAEQRLFWRDLRRVLFSGARYTVLGRLARDGTPDSWTPVKLADVLGEIPGLSDQFNAASRSMVAAFSAGAPTDEVDDTALLQALLAYGRSIAHAGGQPLDEEELQAVATELARGSADGVQDQRAYFDELIRSLPNLAAVQLSRDERSDLRYEALSRAGLALSAPPARAQAPLAPAAVEDERFLDIELVAIYW